MNFETQIAADPVDVEDGNLSRRQRLWLLAGVLFLVLMAVLITVRMFRSSAEEEAAAKAAASAAAGPAVTVVVPGRASVEGTVSATGTLAARVEMPVGVVGEGGMVTRVLVEPGAWVGTGQALAVIERSVQAEQIRSLAAQVEVARADARLAQAELSRAEALVGRGFISKADIDRKRATRDANAARVNVAAAQLNEARARTGRLDIRAPAAGLVLTRAVEPGQVVGSGSGVLFRMARAGEMELQARVSEADLARLKVGDQATVTPVGSSRQLTGRVWQLSPVVDPQTRQGTARILLRYDPSIRPGGFGAVSIVSGVAEAPVLPESAVLNDERGQFVYIVNADKKVERRPVKSGQATPRGIAVISGLTGREQVVLMAGAFLTAGQKVRPQRATGR